MEELLLCGFPRVLKLARWASFSDLAMSSVDFLTMEVVVVGQVFRCLLCGFVRRELVLLALAIDRGCQPGARFVLFSRPMVLGWAQARLWKEAEVVRSVQVSEGTGCGMGLAKVRRKVLLCCFCLLSL